MSVSGTGTYHILIAEDDEDDFSIFQKILNRSHPDIQLTRFKNGEELLAYLFQDEKRSVSLLVLDISMPRMGGWDALKEIKSRSAFKLLPIVVLTSASSSDAHRVRPFPKTSFFTKPSDYQAYIDLVTSLANRIKAKDS